MKTTEIELIKWVYRWNGNVVYSQAMFELIETYYYEN